MIEIAFNQQISLGRTDIWTYWVVLFMSMEYLCIYLILIWFIHQCFVVFLLYTHTHTHTHSEIYSYFIWGNTNVNGNVFLISNSTCSLLAYCSSPPFEEWSPNTWVSHYRSSIKGLYISLSFMGNKALPKLNDLKKTFMSLPSWGFAIWADISRAALPPITSGLTLLYNPLLTCQRPSYLWRPLSLLDRLESGCLSSLQILSCSLAQIYSHAGSVPRVWEITRPLEACLQIHTIPLPLRLVGQTKLLQS